MKINLVTRRPEGREDSFAQGIGKWDIEDADLTVEITGEYGGVIEDFGEPVKGDSERKRSSFDFHQILMVIVVTVCLAFLMVVARDVIVGALTFKIFIEYVIYFLAAIGVANIKRLIPKSMSE